MKRSTTVQAVAIALSAIVIVVLAALTVSAQDRNIDSPVLDQLYEDVYNEDAPVRNAVYLYLRIAGAIWIVVEWIAAIVLIWAYRDLKRAWAAPPTDPLTEQ